MNEEPATAQERIAEELTWQWELRADLNVARQILGGEEPDGVHGIWAPTVVDGLFCWLDELGVLKKLAAIAGVEVRRMVIPFETWVLLYFLRCLARCPSQRSLPNTLFSDTGLMKHLGFNAHQIEHGITNRGTPSRKKPRKNLPLDPEALSNNIVKLPLDAVRTVFHECLCLLWRELAQVADRRTAD